jgi:hypothetical protein
MPEPPAIDTIESSPTAATSEAVLSEPNIEHLAKNLILG